MINKYDIETELFIESMELLFARIDSENSISLLLESGDNPKRESVLLKAISAIVKKINEILNSITDNLSGKDSDKYYRFIKQVSGKIPDCKIAVSVDISKLYEVYSKSHKIILDNYRTSKDYSYIDEVDKLFTNEINKSTTVTLNEIVLLFNKYKDLANKYDNLTYDIERLIYRKSKSNESVSDLKSALLKITKIANGIRNTVSKIAPEKVIRTTEFKNSIKSSIDNDTIKTNAIPDGILNAMRIHGEHTRMHDENNEMHNQNHQLHLAMNGMM